jgi:chaperonin cofactor prefoldin
MGYIQERDNHRASRGLPPIRYSDEQLMAFGRIYREQHNRTVQDDLEDEIEDLHSTIDDLEDEIEKLKKKVIS